MERKEDKRVLAMKYVNKQLCVRQNALKNVMEEVQFLRELDHPFVVGLWYTFQVRSVDEEKKIFHRRALFFQDAEDLFIIIDPLLGGDLRYVSLKGV